MAIGHFLSIFPENKKSEELLELIKEGSDEIVFWFPFEDFDPEWVAEHIETMQRSLLDDLQWAAEVK